MTDEEPISIREAARKMKMDRTRARELAISLGCAIPWGGGKRHTYLKVMFSEFRQAVLSQRVGIGGMLEPDAAPRRRKPSMLGVFNPDVTC